MSYMSGAMISRNSVAATRRTTAVLLRAAHLDKTNESVAHLRS